MAVAITRTADVAGSQTGTTITHSGVSIGTAAADRIIVLCVGVERSGQTIDSATIDFGSGDTAMTALTLANFGIQYSRIFWLAVPTGTTATFKVTFGVSTGTANYGLTIYSVTGSSGAVTASGTDTSTDMDVTDPLTTGSITIPTNGGFIAVASGAADGDAKTWANATEDIDRSSGGSGFRHTTATSITGGTVTVTCTGGTNGEDGALSWMTFSPAAGAAGNFFAFF